ncbi:MULTISPECIES: hypothetical protein [Streptomyces]|uniref:hypothetical protein n=1 Tax=Streptomyces TaxID=1883 RepID=UPI001180C529|nr:hypothetical protein [Streptomyces sp. b62]
MTDTTFVALITATATLLSSSITGVVGYVAARHQLKSQTLLQTAQISAGNEASVRELRRSAYVAVLNQHSIVERAMRAAWEDTACAELNSSGRYDELNRELNALQERLHLAELEGSLDIAARAARIMAFESQSMSDLLKVVAENAASTQTPAHHAAEMAASSWGRRIDVRDSFIGTAREVLGTSF